MTLTSAQYVEKKGTCCPNCHGTDVDGSQVNIDSGVASQDCFCPNCAAEWTDVYHLVGYSNLSVPGVAV